MTTVHLLWSTSLLLIPALLLMLLFGWPLIAAVAATPNSIASHIYPTDRLVVQEGQGFLVKLVTPPGFGTVKFCTFLYANGQQFPLHPTSENEMIYVAMNGERVERFTVQECGVKVSNVSAASSGRWKLGATSGRNSAGGVTDASGEFQLQVIPAVKSDSEAAVVHGRPGEWVTINCTVNGDNDPGDYCEMWDRLKENEKRETCQWRIKVPADLTQRMDINCRTFTEGSMVPIERLWTVQGEYAGTTTDYLNSDSSVVLRCKSSQNSLTGCVIRNRQTEQVYRITNGLKGTRYSSFRTHLGKGLCQFEIPKPVKVHEVGKWSLRMFYGGENKYEECLFTVTDGTVFKV